MYATVNIALQSRPGLELRSLSHSLIKLTNEIKTGKFNGKNILEVTYQKYSSQCLGFNHTSGKRHVQDVFHELSSPIMHFLFNNSV